MDDKTLDRLLQGALAEKNEVSPSLVQKARQKADKAQCNQEMVQYYLPLLIAVSLNIIFTASIILFLRLFIRGSMIRNVIEIGMSCMMNLPFVAYLLIKEIKGIRQNKKGGVK